VYKSSGSGNQGGLRKKMARLQQFNERKSNIAFYFSSF